MGTGGEKWQMSRGGVKWDTTGREGGGMQREEGEKKEAQDVG